MIDRRLLFVAALLILAGSVRAVSQEIAAPSRSNRVEESAQWAMETLHRADGKQFNGLLMTRRKEEVEFVEVRRPTGRKWYLVIHYYHPRSVKEIERIEKSERERLLERIGPLLEHKSHAGIEAGRMEDVTLTVMTRDDESWRQYDGALFDLTSSADDETTRRCVVRIEQLFRAFRHTLPSRATRDDKLLVRLEGSMDAYFDELARRKVTIENPAVFYSKRNEILAGSELTRFSERLAELRELNEQRRKEYEILDRDFPSRLKALAAQLRRGGFSGAEIEAETRARSAAWKRELAAKMTQIAEVDRRNTGKFAAVTRQMFLRLYHEAFHAYLENYVYPHKQFDVPRWLNEGLAQVFESGQLDGDTLRLDRPDPTLLKQLQADLSSRRPLPLAQLLSSKAQAFLVTHDDGQSSARHYLYAWGLAHFLVFEKNLLSDKHLDNYVAANATQLSPVDRFEQLVSMPLADFEREWHAAMLAARGSSK